MVARRLATLADRTSRRGFLATVGRAGLALMGGSFLALWQTEAAWAACGPKNPNPTPRLTCLCSELLGSNNCPSCCGGFWVSCIKNIQDPASCCTTCPNTMIQCNKVKLFDCCSACSGIGCNGSHPNCNPNFGNDTCCHTGYCADGGCTAPVRCVRKVCTTNSCLAC